MARPVPTRPNGGLLMAPPNLAMRTRPVAQAHQRNVVPFDNRRRSRIGATDEACLVGLRQSLVSHYLLNLARFPRNSAANPRANHHDGGGDWIPRVGEAVLERLVWR